MIYRELYEWGAASLMKAGIDEAKLDARLLLEFVCGTDRNSLLVHGDREVEEEDAIHFSELVEERRKRIPLQYLTGEQEFMGLRFRVNENVLIPRQDTEILVEEVMRNLTDGTSILDMCTGSGCILLSLLHYSNHCLGVGVDLSEKALEVARENARQICKAAWDAQEVTFVQSDLFEAVEGNFDLIVSNPPYIASSVIPTLMPEVRQYEPMMALDGAEDGLLFYRKIIDESRKYLKRGGMLYFEIGYDQGIAVRNLMEQAGFQDVAVVKDYAGLNRVVYGRL